MCYWAKILLFLIVIGICYPQSTILGHSGSVGDSDTVLYFRNASSKLLHIYRTNSAALAHLDVLFTPPRRAIDSVLIIGGASPVGAYNYNRRLSLERAYAVRNYLYWLYPHIRQYRLIPVVDSLSYTSRPILGNAHQTDWNADQRRVVVSIAWAADTLYTLDTSDTVLSPATLSTLEPALLEKALDTVFADPYRLPCTDVSASASVVSNMPTTRMLASAPDSVAGVSVGQMGTVDSLSFGAAVPVSDSVGAFSLRVLPPTPLGPRFALKTNMLYWAALTPNIEAEWYFARRWSVNLEFQSAWWANRQSHKYFRLMAGGPEVRYWIAHREHFRGHFIGAYIGAGLYEFMGRPNYGLQGEFYITGGISYGYSFRIGKRLRMEASVGVGYLKTEYREYHWDAGCYVYDRTKRQTYFGPTKVKLTLTYPLWWLGSKRKGGIR